MEKNVLTEKELSLLCKKLKRFKVEENFIKKAILRKGRVLITEVVLKSYQEAEIGWTKTRVSSKEEKFFLGEMIHFALLDEDFDELLGAYDFATKSLDEVGKITIIKAMIKLLFQEKLETA